jgi:hypothetical protein
MRSIQFEGQDLVSAASLDASLVRMMTIFVGDPAAKLASSVTNQYQPILKTLLTLGMVT